MKTTKDLSKKYSDEETDKYHSKMAFSIFMSGCFCGAIIVTFITWSAGVVASRASPFFTWIDALPPTPVAIGLIVVLAFVGYKLVRR